MTITDRARKIMDTAECCYVIDPAKVDHNATGDAALYPALVARIWVKYPRDGAGRLRVVVADYSREYNDRIQEGSAGGYGYDKRTAALSGLTVGGVVLRDHGEGRGTLRDVAQERGWAILGTV